MFVFRRLLLPVVVGAWLALGGSSCLSPTLPLPPPEVPETIFQSGPGEWTITGNCQPGALVSVMNEKTDRGESVQLRPNETSYSVVLEANECDVATVIVVLDGESASTSFVVQELHQGEPTSAACQR